MEIDYSQLSCCQACPMKYYLTYIKNLSKIKYDEREIDKEFGKGVHEFLELHHKKKDTSKIWSNFIDLPNEPCKTAKHGNQLCQNYLNHYKLVDANDKILALEIVDKFKLTRDITYIVKIDKIINRNDNIYAVDYKTAKNKKYNYFNQFNPNTQVTGYTTYVFKKYGQCSGLIVDVLGVGFRKRAYKGEPPGFHMKFEREIVNRTKEQMEDFHSNVISCVKEIERRTRENDWPKYEISCGDFRGCSFRELCLTSVGTNLDKEIVESLYEVKDNKEYLK